MMEKIIGYSLEPWSFESNSSFVDICDSMGKIVADTGASSCRGDADLGIENARRIVACVNACSRFSTEHLENYPLISEHGFSMYESVKAQRDELLAALKLSCQYMDKVPQAILSAIAKCEVQS